MIEKTFILNSNMDARAAAHFVQSASNFKASVYIRAGGSMLNAKSIMGMMAIGILEGQEVTIVVDGIDEEDAIADLAKFFTQL